MLIIDDGSGSGLRASNGQIWRCISDQIMGGVSAAALHRCRIENREALHLVGKVSLANNGGFVQMALDLAPAGSVIDASGYTGLALMLRCAGDGYKIHLRGPDLTRPWQSWRCDLPDAPEWTQLYLPFSSFYPHRTELPLQCARLSRLGVVAIGREMEADIAIARLAFYRKPAS